MNALEKSKNVALIVLPGLSRCELALVDDDVGHAESGLVRELQWVHGVAHPGLRCCSTSHSKVFIMCKISTTGL